jgi:hypothetical protein
MLAAQSADERELNRLLQAIWLMGAHAWPVGMLLPRHQISGLPDLLDIVR